MADNSVTQNKILFLPIDIPKLKCDMDLINENYDLHGNSTPRPWHKLILRSTSIKTGLLKRYNDYSDDWSWTPGARIYFPQVIEAIEMYLPFKVITLVAFLRPDTEDGSMFPHKDFNPSDKDAEDDFPSSVRENEPYSYRFVIGPFENIFYLSSSSDINGARVFPRLPSSTNSFVFNCSAVYHGVHQAPANRAVLAISGLIDPEKHKELLRKSLVKYNQYLVTKKDLFAATLSEPGLRRIQDSHFF